MWLFKRWFKPTPKIIPMTEKQAWAVYAAMNRIPDIKELFELRRQLAYIECAKNKKQFNASWGRIMDIEEIIENMESATKELAALETRVNDNAPGFKSSIE
jgi:hypothetical protein